ncbi:uncharacterized protein BCR38DRAFT_400002 [Pseudomassariella vexata]|uniref:Rhodopsin domain-containing protein n=1 Tax=Pseudomassariella vexata TaxID=1141098 RepID=A0A1Y2DJC9_9PEZI|nr:uncharacterized protein BCR38DRAFT_400002 [Pseudomassariella vexata]ORY58905.1 hypothetical protein BCR38DRAFT_400002 [Pseudomassariella vexata]
MSLIFTPRRDAAAASTTTATAESADRGPELNVATTCLLVLATAFVGLRFWARRITSYAYGADDWMLVAGLVVVFITGSLNYAMISYGLGRHASEVPLADLVVFFKLLLAFECIYVTGVMLIKLSILQMYLRIFPSKQFKISAAAIAFVVIGWWIAIVFVCIFQCTPVSKAWLPWSEGKCIDLKASFIGNAIPNILTDVAILCMPIGQVWKLQAKLIQKLSLCFAFLLGSFVLFASIYRFSTIMQFEIADTTWTLATACTWCVVETACGVISACLPTLRPLLAKVTSGFSLAASRGTGAKDYQNRSGSELVTIGGGGSRSAKRNFETSTGDRAFSNTDLFTPLGSRTDHASERTSGDEFPLKQTV